MVIKHRSIFIGIGFFLAGYLLRGWMAARYHRDHGGVTPDHSCLKDKNGNANPYHMIDFLQRDLFRVSQDREPEYLIDELRDLMCSCGYPVEGETSSRRNAIFREVGRLEDRGLMERDVQPGANGDFEDWVKSLMEDSGK